MLELLFLGLCALCGERGLCTVRAFVLYAPFLRDLVDFLSLAVPDPETEILVL